MKNFFYIIFFCVLIFSGLGCSAIQEGPRILWGSSVKALSDNRGSAVKKNINCFWEDCFEAVVAYADKAKSGNPEKDFILGKKPEENSNADNYLKSPLQKIPQKTNFTLFLKDKNRRVIVLMGVPGSVDTTEVGVFFAPLEKEGTSVEISSLSTAAKIKTSEMVFEELNRLFSQ